MHPGRAPSGSRRAAARRPRAARCARAGRPRARTDETAPRLEPRSRATAARNERPDVPLVAENNVLGDSERRHETEVLVHHRDPRFDRVAWRVEVDRPSGEKDLAFVRPVEACEDVGQRRLAGAVLSQKGVHFSFCSLEVDVVVRDNRGKPLRDSPQSNGGRHGGRIGRGSLNFPAHGISLWRCRSRL